VIGRRTVGRLRRDLRGAAGTVADVFNIVRNRFENPHSYTKFLLIQALARRSGADTFIEAGTFRAVTAERCCRVFQRVFTIELDPQLAAAARLRLAPHTNCTLIENDAANVLTELLSRDDLDNIFVSLDAHFCGEGTATGDVPDPALEELESLAPYHRKIRALVIDDFRSFGTELGFPPKWCVVRAAEELFVPKGFKLSVILDQLVLERA
jgi:hypothetical protein